jgi:hypothetical protein
LVRKPALKTLLALTTFISYGFDNLFIVNSQFSPKEIWEKANEIGTLGDFVTTGKNPWATIGAYCYTDIQRAGDNVAFSIHTCGVTSGPGKHIVHSATYPAVPMHQTVQVGKPVCRIFTGYDSECHLFLGHHLRFIRPFSDLVYKMTCIKFDCFP